MIKKYLEYIKENNSSYVHKELIEIPEFDQIIDDALIDFLEDNNFKCEMLSKKIFLYKLLSKNEKIWNSYSLDDEYMIDSEHYFCYGYHISLEKENFSPVIDSLKINYVQNKLNNFYNGFKFISSNINGVNYSYILGTPIKYSDKDVMDYYNIQNYKIDDKGIYTELSFDDLAEMCLEKKSIYKRYFTSTDSIWDSYYDNDYDCDFFYLNKENKEKYSLLEDEELVSDIKRTIEDYERDAQVEKNLEELWIEFVYQLNEREGLKVELVKGKYYPYILDGDESKDNSIFKVYFVNKLLDDVDDRIQNMSLYELIHEYFYNSGRISLNPQFSSYGDVDTNNLNKDVANLLKDL